jgi:hypothetical protein
MCMLCNVRKLHNAFSKSTDAEVPNSIQAAAVAAAAAAAAAHKQQAAARSVEHSVALVKCELSCCLHVGNTLLLL